MQEPTTAIWNVTIPKALPKEVAQYLYTLASTDNELLVKETLRGRRYLKGVTSDLENNITTKDLNALIDNGLLVRTHIREGYKALKPNPYALSYIANAGKKQNIYVGAGDDVKGNNVQHFRALEKGEYAKLVAKGTRLTVRFKTEPFKKSAFKAGYNYSDIYLLLDTLYPCYFIVTANNKILQVYPNDVYGKQAKSNQIPIEHTITADRVSVSSQATATSYVNVTKKVLPTYDAFIQTYKQAVKSLSDSKVRTTGKKKVEEQIKDPASREQYESFAKQYDVLFKELVVLATQLVDEGIVPGGMDKNPTYRQAWEVQNKLTSLTTTPVIKSVTSKYRRFLEIIEHYEDGSLERYNSIQL